MNAVFCFASAIAGFVLSVSAVIKLNIVGNEGHLKEADRKCRRGDALLGNFESLFFSWNHVFSLLNIHGVAAGSYDG